LRIIYLSATTLHISAQQHTGPKVWF